MRAGLSTIQQTLTPEAASVLTQSIKEAARRNHGQTTPLHVAATLLATPSGLLRQACVRSHPHSSHPLQCRALELCFSVALERLPTSSSSSNPPNPAANSTTSTSPSSSGVAEPPISNALMAALKRAQANQRRGCPEQQQQPLLAVKVELEQLIISILDDPSVSRVMREASFSSPAVKSTIEQSLASSSSAAATAPSTPSSPSSALGINLAHRTPLRNPYINPRLHQHQANFAAAGGGADPHRREEVTRVMDILMRCKKRNPVLVGDSDPDAVMREVLQRIQSGDASPPLRAAQVISFEKEFDRPQIPSRIRELGSSIEARIGGGGGGGGHGVVLNLGDLKWLVESAAGLGASMGPAPAQPQAIISEVGRAVVVEMGRLLKSFAEGGRLWLVGTATCATYLRCQVYHPTMENDWDLQAVPIAPRSPLPCIFPRCDFYSQFSSSSSSSALLMQAPGLLPFLIALAPLVSIFGPIL